MLLNFTMKIMFQVRERTPDEPEYNDNGSVFVTQVPGEDARLLEFDHGLKIENYDTIGG